MLKQELRKLREEDMQKIKERQKRQENNRKARIIEKQLEHENAIKAFKDGEKSIMQKKVEL
jgi:hypothetical protein